MPAWAMALTILGAVGAAVTIVWCGWVATRAFLHRPSIGIKVADPADRAGEDWLEWMHIEVSNAATTVARDARIQAVINGECHDLVWATDTQVGPQPTQDLARGSPLYVPLVLKTRRDFTLPRYCPNVELRQGVCYVSGNQLLIQCNPCHALEPGDYRIRVIVRFSCDDQGHEAAASFTLVVPSADSGQPITLRAN